ncbi:STAS domain-containing protein [Domibacillus antri]
MSKVADYLNKNAKFLSVEIVEAVLQKMNLQIPDWEKEQAVNMYIDFIGFLGKSIISEKETMPKELITWSKQNGEREASSGGKISEIIVRYPPTRMIFTEIITRISLENRLSIEGTAFLIKRVNAMLDISINETLFAFERLSEQLKQETQKEMAELSAPVVPIQDGLAVLPLIGTIDSYRAAYILEKVVPKIADFQLNYLIADFSGIFTIDTEIAQYLYNIENILRLLGVQTIVTGLRPEIAQTIVKAGIDMSPIMTFAHVKQALESLKAKSV